MQHSAELQMLRTTFLDKLEAHKARLCDERVEMKLRLSARSRERRQAFREFLGDSLRPSDLGRTFGRVNPSQSEFAKIEQVLDLRRQFGDSQGLKQYGQNHDQHYVQEC